MKRLKNIDEFAVERDHKKLADGGFHIRDIIVKAATNRAAILGRPKIGSVFL